jgi:type IV pilus assembly protein PilX
MIRPETPPTAQRGMVLIASLLLLLVVTIMAVSLFRSFGIDEKIASNTREKEIALTAAETAEQYAEQWLTDNTVTTVNCTQPLVAPLSQACLNAAPAAFDPGPNGSQSVTNLPWTINNVSAGVTWQPAGMSTASLAGSNGANGVYTNPPVYYISYLGAGTAPDGVSQGTVYQIDAAGYGSVQGTKAVVESTFIVVPCKNINVGEVDPCT